MMAPVLMRVISEESTAKKHLALSGSALRGDAAAGVAGLVGPLRTVESDLR